MLKRLSAILGIFLNFVIMWIQIFWLNYSMLNISLLNLWFNFLELHLFFNYPAFFHFTKESYTSVDFREHSSPIFKCLNIVKLSDLVFRNIAVFMYNFHNRRLPSVFDTFFTQVNKRYIYNTRSVWNDLFDQEWVQRIVLTKGWRSKRQLFFYSLRWPIYVFNSVVNTKLPAEYNKDCLIAILKGHFENVSIQVTWCDTSHVCKVVKSVVSRPERNNFALPVRLLPEFTSEKKNFFQSDIGHHLETMNYEVKN